MNKIIKSKLLVPIGIYLITALPILYFILKYGVDIPYWDQWEYVSFFDHFSKGTLTFKELFAQHNEYRQIVPNLIFVLLGSLTNWNVRYEMIVIFLMASIISFQLLLIAEKTLIMHNWQKWFLYLLLNVFIFSPSQFENWLFGVQIVYYLPVLCFVTGLVTAFSKRKIGFKLLICIVLSVISTLSSANGLLCWLLIIPILFYTDENTIKWKRGVAFFIWIIAASLSILLYFLDYHQPDYHKTLLNTNLNFTNVAGYFFNLMGNPLFGNLSINKTISVGVVLTISFAIFLLYLAINFRKNELIKKTCPWVLLGVFSLMNGVLITFGRASFGIKQSFASRYITFTLFLLLAVTFLTIIVFFNNRKEGNKWNKYRSLLMIIPISILIVHLNAFEGSVKRLKDYAYNIRKAKAGLLFIEFVDHGKCKNKLYPAGFPQLKKRAELLDSMDYLRPKLIRSNIIDELELKTDQLFGSLNLIEKNKNSEWIASGFASYNSGNFYADAILISYENENGESVLLAFDNSGKEKWTINFSTEVIATKNCKISAWIFDAEKGVAIRLKGSYEVTG